MKNILLSLHRDTLDAANKEKAKILQRFFKTGPGEYGEGDKFLGITVPQSRIIAKKYSHLSLAHIKKLLTSSFHEERLIALLILVHNFEHGDIRAQKQIFDFYLRNARYINNWDLVDLSADKIIGSFLLKTSKNSTALLKRLAHSRNMWERRIAMVSTFAFIKNGKWKEAFTIAEFLLNDKHDLIHKATGWMLREVGKRSGHHVLISFLEKYAARMPRTMLRYAIEHFPEAKRKKYLLSTSASQH